MGRMTQANLQREINNILVENRNRHRRIEAMYQSVLANDRQNKTKTKKSNEKSNDRKVRIKEAKGHEKNDSSIHT